MNSTPEAGTSNASAQPGQPRSWGEIATRFAAAIARDDFRRGDLAELRRMDPDAPEAAVFWRLLAGENLEVSPAIEVKWALILHGIALMTPTGGGTGSHNSAHDRSIPVGRALFYADDPQRTSAFYSHTRLNRLLTARGPMLQALLARMFRMMGDRRPFNWREMARLILNDGYNEERAEDVRRGIARAYYQAERQSEQSNSQ